MATETDTAAFSSSTCEVECDTSDPRMVEARRKVAALGPVDLTSYDVIVVNTSGGKDSQAAMDVLVEAATAQGVLDRVTVVHCDLGRCEWQGVRELAVRQAAAYGLGCTVVSRPGNDLLDQVRYERKAWPAIGLAQFCTSDHKTSQAAKVVTELTKRVRVAEGLAPLSPQRKVRVLQVLGIRAQESGRRAQREPFANRADNRLKTEDEWFPIFDYTTEQVWERIRQSGVEHHPAYDLGMSRLSCCFCVVARLADLRVAAQHNQQLLAQYVQVERELDAYHRDQQAAAGTEMKGHTFKQGWALETLWTELYGDQDLDAAATGTQPSPVATDAEQTPEPQQQLAERVARQLGGERCIGATVLVNGGLRIGDGTLRRLVEHVGLEALGTDGLHVNSKRSVRVQGEALRRLAALILSDQTR